MGWRDVLKRSMGGGETMSDATHLAVSCLLAMPPADRIALARELLAGTGRVVARDPGECGAREILIVPVPGVASPFKRGFLTGFKTCRAAMLGEEGE